jgi:mannosyltransferase
LRAVQSTRSSSSSPLRVACDTRRVSRRIWVWAGLEALLAFALAMFQIDARSLWYDEGVSAMATGSSWGVLEHVARTFDPNMSGYHVVLHLWQGAFGNSETALRSLSAVAFAAAVLMIVALGRRLHDERTGLIAGLLLAVAPFVVRYGQELRSYALEVFMVTTLTYLFVRIVDPENVDGSAAHQSWPVIAYGAAAGFSCYVHMYTTFVLAAHVVSLALLDPACVPWVQLRRSARWVAVQMVPMLLWMAAGPSEQLGWIARPSPVDFLRVASEIVGGGLVSVALFALVGTVVVGFVRSFTRDRRTHAQWADGLGLLWIVMPFVLSAVVSTVVKPIFLSRYMIVVVPAVALVAATGLTRLRVRPLAIGALSVIVIGSLVTIDRAYGGHKANWRDAVDYMAAHATPSDGVVICPAKARLPVTYYVTRRMPSVLRPVPLSPTGKWGSFRVRRVSKATAAGWLSRGPDRIWVLGKRHRCDFTFPGREHTVSVGFTGTAVERFDRR